MMQRINLSVKILVSQVNTAVLLHEELDISTVGKILPSLKREQRKREKQKGKKKWFSTPCSSKLQSGTPWPGAGSGTITVSASGVCGGGGGRAPENSLFAPSEHRLVLQCSSFGSSKFLRSVANREMLVWPRSHVDVVWHVGDDAFQKGRAVM